VTRTIGDEFERDFTAVVPEGLVERFATRATKPESGLESAAFEPVRGGDLRFRECLLAGSFDQSGQDGSRNPEIFKRRFRTGVETALDQLTQFGDRVTVRNQRGEDRAEGAEVGAPVRLVARWPVRDYKFRIGVGKAAPQK
jgi:hypothetical protein